MSWPPFLPLRRSGDFLRVLREGQRWRSRWGTLVVRPRLEGGLRVGWEVRRTLGGAVVRNLARRRLKEAYRRVAVHLQGSADLVFIPAPRVVKACFEDLVAGLEEICCRAGLGPDLRSSREVQ